MDGKCYRKVRNDQWPSGFAPVGWTIEHAGKWLTSRASPAALWRRCHSPAIFSNSFCKHKKTGVNTARTLYNVHTTGLWNQETVTISLSSKGTISWLNFYFSAIHFLSWALYCIGMFRKLRGYLPSNLNKLKSSKSKMLYASSKQKAP